ncbi:MAG: ATP phosphoribosyltransferase regulatory subunit, partial [Alphaproteobacteria bacterium]|nr:ATP phosphoribosyltransferase regulatory subunit [Alphaproteobacteria bacterium]
IDPVENRGFEYHTGLCLTLFARGVQGELGRGGRYLAGADFAGGEGEPATGFTLYTDTVLRALPPREASAVVFLPLETAPEIGPRLRAEGWTTLAGLTPTADAALEARRLGCTHVWSDGRIVDLRK